LKVSKYPLCLETVNLIHPNKNGEIITICIALRWSRSLRGTEGRIIAYVLSAISVPVVTVKSILRTIRFLYILFFKVDWSSSSLHDHENVRDSYSGPVKLVHILSALVSSSELPKSYQLQLTWKLRLRSQMNPRLLHAKFAARSIHQKERLNQYILEKTDQGAGNAKWT
jgi:hypothetical protein